MLPRSAPALLGCMLLCGVVLGGIGAPFLSSGAPKAVHLVDRLKPPIWAPGHNSRYPLGTDSLGRDVWTRLLYGARVSLLVGVVSVVISGMLGTSLGLLGGYAGGVVDAAVMRLADIQLAFPFILLAVTLMAVFGPGLLNIIIVLGVSRWVDYARVVRGEVLSLRGREFVDAARAQGASNGRIVVRHLLPNMIGPITIIASFAIASNILYEASLSFLGLGVDPTIATWGGMAAEGRSYITRASWIATFPGLAILCTVLGINLVGDWLRDRLDPRLRVE